MFKIKEREKKGGMLAESLIVISLFFPILVAILLVVLEASYAYVIDRSLTQGARMAARSLAAYHATNPEVVYTTAEQQAIFSQVRIPNMISGNGQFAIPQGGWNVSTAPPTVTVVVQYLPGQGDPPLPIFPAFDPLRVGSVFNIKASATYALD